MSSTRRAVIVILVGLLLLGLPFAVGTVLLQLGGGRYQPPQTGTLDLAATPEPTVTAMPMQADVAAPAGELKPGPVVVDLAHFNLVSPSQFQPLTAQLATLGVSLRFWTNPTPAAEVDLTNLAGLADQSVDLETQLRDASALVVVSPLFLWKPDEVDVVEAFVADGGRLLLISDPDITEVPDYYIRDINKLGEPFGIVFNDDYLYDLSRNDSNYTHLFQGEFLDRAAELSGKTIALYGTRSLGGPIISQVRTANTALSSLRSGLTSLTTVAIGGQEINNTAGKVLAMGDFDVLTEPYVGRHDNYLMLDFVADFLAGARRDLHLTDFPAYLGPRVALAFGEGMPLDAPFVVQSSQLQQQLRESGRTLEMIGPASYVLTGTLTFTRSASETTPITSLEDYTDLIYVASFEAAQRDTTLLSGAGVRLADVFPTPEPVLDTPTPTPSATASPSPAASPSGTPETPTATPMPSATSTPTATPQPTPVLETDFSPQLLADQSTLILRKRLPGDKQVTAVLGSDVAAIDSAVNRLITHDFIDCVTYPDVVLCPFSVETVEPTLTEEASPVPGSEETTEGPAETPESEEPSPPSENAGNILVVDDDRTKASGEESEAQVYTTVLQDMGYQPASRSTAVDGDPTADDLAGYRWVIWSSGVYRGGDVDADVLAQLALFLDAGGRLTVSGRTSVLGAGDLPPSAVADVALTDALPGLVVGLSGTPIQLAADLPPATPLTDVWGSDAKIVMRRGPQSDDADTPLMVALEEATKDGGTRRATVLGMALNWLPEADATQLVRNVAAWMME